MNYKRILLALVFLLACVCGALAQNPSAARRLNYGTALPSTCDPTSGEVFIKVKIGGTPASQYFCSDTNTWTELDAATGEGTVTSVGLSLPPEFSVTGSPVTTTGTLTATWASQSANKVLAAPSGGAGVLSPRLLVEADIPTLAQTKITNLVSDLAAKQTLDSDLTAIAALSSTGIVARTGAGTASTRTVTAGTGVTVTNGDGVSGNPTIAIGQAVATISTPQFARVGVGVAADATAPLVVSTKGKFSSVGNLSVNSTDADNEDGIGVGSAGGQIRLVGNFQTGIGHTAALKLLPDTTGIGRWWLAGIGTDFVQAARQGNFEFYDVNAATPRMIIDSSGRMGVATGYTQPFSSTLTVGAGDTATLSLGGGVTWSRGSGAPAGACTSGSLYSRTPGGVGLPGLYVCENSAWVAK